MTTTDPHRVDALLAQYPGPVRLASRPAKWLLAGVCSVVLLALNWFFVLPQGGSLYTMAGWLGIAVFAFAAVGALGNLVPGVAYLKLDPDGFESKTMFGRKRVPWKVASNFRAEGSALGRRVAFDIYTNEPPRSGLFNYLIRRMATVNDNYGMPPDDLARLMNAWRAKAVAGSL
jgi:hypothetical protein